MPKRRPTTDDALMWSDPALVFSDTERVDLFDDPRWESGASVRSPKGSPGADRGRRTAKRVIPFRRPKRGLHSIKAR
jgi:hypothetical protein